MWDQLPGGMHGLPESGMPVQSEYFHYFWALGRFLRHSQTVKLYNSFLGCKRKWRMESLSTCKWWLLDTLHLRLQWQQKLWRSVYSWLQDKTSGLSLWSKIWTISHIAKFNSFIQANCPAGCPCDEFNCLDTTTSADHSTSTAPMTTTTAITTMTTTSTSIPATPNAVLVLSTYNSENKPMVVTLEGLNLHMFLAIF